MSMMVRVSSIRFRFVARLRTGREGEDFAGDKFTENEGRYSIAAYEVDAHHM